MNRSVVANRIVGCLMPCLILIGGRAAEAGDIRYMYDAAGRLALVVAPSGETASYSYDANGNLTSIDRATQGALSLVSVEPVCGSAGTVVTINGTGFSSTPNENVVTFNSVTATVTAASATQIVTSVPTGATTGPIDVNPPGVGSALSVADFVIGCGAPTITGFSPQQAPRSTGPQTSNDVVVTITGTGFEATAAGNRVEFDGQLAFVLPQSSPGSTTAIAVLVPPAATSGPISVTTAAGTAASAQNFIVQ